MNSSEEDDATARRVPRGVQLPGYVDAGGDGLRCCGEVGGHAADHHAGGPVEEGVAPDARIVDLSPYLVEDLPERLVDAPTFEPGHVRIVEPWSGRAGRVQPRVGRLGESTLPVGLGLDQHSVEIEDDGTHDRSPKGSLIESSDPSRALARAAALAESVGSV